MSDFEIIHRVGDYGIILNNIEQVRNILGKDAGELHLPQLVVVGDQSSGKSSLLKEICQVPFPTDHQICTKCPIIVHMKKNLKIESPKYSIKNENENKDTKIDDDYDEIDYEDVEEAIRQRQIALLEGGEQKVVETPIRIKVTGPNINDLVLVDLPGIISNGDGQQEVINMINTYIEPIESLILVVTTANQDDETAKALELAKNVDPEEKRTMRILSKFDSFDTPKRSELVSREFANSIGHHHPHAIACRINGNDYDANEEIRMLMSHIPQQMMEFCGISTLKERLVPIQCQLVESNLPGLRERINNMINQHTNQLRILGDSPPDRSGILTNIKRELENMTREWEQDITEPMVEFREGIRATKEMINDKFVEDRYRFNAFECVFFQGENTFNQCMRDLVIMWREHADVLHNAINDILSTMLVHINDIGNISLQLRQKLRSHWNNKQSEMLVNLHNQVERSLMAEQHYKTLNHYLTAKYQEQLVMPDELVDEIIDGITQDMYSITRRQNPTEDNRIAKPLEDICDKFRQHLVAKVEENIEMFNRMALEDQHKRRILAAVRANWSVADKNLVDNVLESIINTILIEVRQWLEEIRDNDEIREVAVEDPRIARDRDTLMDKLEKMRQTQEILG